MITAWGGQNICHAALRRCSGPVTHSMMQRRAPIMPIRQFSNPGGSHNRAKIAVLFSLPFLFSGGCFVLNFVPSEPSYSTVDNPMPISVLLENSVSSAIACMNDPVAVIAGTGDEPVAICRELHRANKQFCVVMLSPEDNFDPIREHFGLTTDIIAQQRYKLGVLFNDLEKRGIKQVIFAGKLDASILEPRLDKDWFSVKLFMSPGGRQSFMENLCNKLQESGMATAWANELLSFQLSDPQK